MHVVIANITNGGLSGGSRKYLEHICPLMLRDARISRLDLYVPEETSASLGDRLGTTVRSWPASDPRTGFPQLRREIRNLQPDVMFIPSARWLACGDIPTVVMVRNMEPLLVPGGGNPWKETLKNYLRAHVARRAGRRAALVIAVSRFVSDFVRHSWRLPEERVAVIYHGVDSLESLPTDDAPAGLDAAEPFLFTAGSIRPARGLEDALLGLAALHAEGRRIRLAIAGATNPGTEAYQQRMAGLARRLGLQDHVLWLAQLDRRRMAWCFAHAAAFVMTSRVEACPNIVLEAMQHGCLSVSTDCPPMPEFFGSAAYYYHAGDPASLASQLRAALTAPAAVTDQLRTAARQRAGQFRWADTAQQTIARLADIARGRQRRNAAA